MQQTENFRNYTITYGIKEVTLVFNFTDQWDSTNMWFDVRQVRKPYKVFPDGAYRPPELGVYMPEVRCITIGRCKNKENRRSAKYRWDREVAHAHPQTGMICLSNGAYVFERAGKVDDVLIHEYAHILAPNDLTHGKEWSDIMIKYGLPPDRKAHYRYEV